MTKLAGKIVKECLRLIDILTFLVVVKSSLQLNQHGNKWLIAARHIITWDITWDSARCARQGSLRLIVWNVS